MTLDQVIKLIELAAMIGGGLIFLGKWQNKTESVGPALAVQVQALSTKLDGFHEVLKDSLKSQRDEMNLKVDRIQEALDSLGAVTSSHAKELAVIKDRQERDPPTREPTGRFNVPVPR